MVFVLSKPAIHTAELPQRVPERQQPVLPLPLPESLQLAHPLLEFLDPGKDGCLRFVLVRKLRTGFLKAGQPSRCHARLFAMIHAL
jgi:hypothetical protein